MPDFSPADREFMSRALDLARRGLYTATPNPRVGAVLVRGGQVVGEGFHEKAGDPHAEVMESLDRCIKAGDDRLGVFGALEELG